jgi:DNA-binding MarR family transcriptional regulator
MEPLLRVVNFFAAECKDFTPQLLKVFLFIATHNGCRQEDISRGTKVSSAAVSHMTKWLSDGKYKEHEPLGWIVKRVSPIDHRAKLIYLTKTGQLVVDNIKAQLYPQI